MALSDDNSTSSAGSGGPRRRKPARSVAQSDERDNAKVLAGRQNGKMRRLPREIRDELDERIEKGLFSSYAELSKWLGDKGYYVSKTGVAHYGAKFLRQLEAVRMAAVEARAIAEETAGDDHAMQQSMMRLVQTHLFEVLKGLLSERRANGKPPNIHAITRSICGLAKTQLNFEKWFATSRDRVQKSVGAAEEHLERARSEGLSPDTAEKIRNALLEIKL